MGWLGDFVENHPAEVASALTALGAALSTAGRWVWARIKEYRSHNAEHRSEALLEIQQQLQRLPDESAVIRAFIVQVTNGGGALTQAGSELYITLKIEAKAPGVEPLRDFWQRRQASPTYRELILKPLINGEQALSIDMEAAPPSDIKDQWLVADVCSVSVALLHRSKDDSVLWYLGVHHAVPLSELTTKEGVSSDEDTETSARSRWLTATVASRIAAILPDAV